LNHYKKNNFICRAEGRSIAGDFGAERSGVPSAGRASQEVH